MAIGDAQSHIGRQWPGSHVRAWVDGRKEGRTEGWMGGWMTPANGCGAVRLREGETVAHEIDDPRRAEARHGSVPRGDACRTQNRRRTIGRHGWITSSVAGTDGHSLRLGTDGAGRGGVRGAGGRTRREGGGGRSGWAGTWSRRGQKWARGAATWHCARAHWTSSTSTRSPLIIPDPVLSALSLRSRSYPTT
ncbi:hypothetical protein MPTK1_1g22690 [Marchantia polymorpha subsp. ruderalis]|uniref:Uncharacterized protein n=2 Tax=Marchantia polymorpha TaxID=3197 RepID=A0AAF6AT74_MARPO|nr:hypothetical protein MARPO_0118s0018 [Marchantia polymorpha]BBM99644.1 hypothetical protein Mp_1g22690 [Marchantia polymorpha subsp. ruderalis]|eukprot:PTQ30881.1 hypothetical protein MARPO_0118s0018 [Marchantia polymorpha]